MTQSAIDRPLSLRKRSDLVVHPQRYAGRNYAGIKNPLSLRYYQLREEEFFVLEQLDGRRSAAEIQAAFEREFAPRKLGVRGLQGFLAMLHREGLIVADAEGQGAGLLERAGRVRRRERLAALGSLLAIRFRGVDPDALLSWLYPKIRYLFSVWMIVGGLAFALAAATLVTVEFEAVRTRLPEFHAFFCLDNVVWFLLAIAVSKVLHELGHGLTCKHFGGECHELGVMLLVFTPCLYVNVSDAWLLPNKWHRIAISAAGMFVEIILAAVCTFLWWFSEPGLLNSICLHLMFVCSVSTVLFNGNPLLRYDGYYILSDLMETPNLRERSISMVRRALARWFLDVDLGMERMYPDRRRGLLVAYAIGAVLYRFVIVTAILWFCHTVLKPYGLQVLAQVLGVLVIGGMLLTPLWRGARFFSNPARRHQVQGRRFVVGVAAIAILLTLALSIPLPHRVGAPAVLQPENARRVFVSVSGILVSAVEPGAAVAKGQPLGQLENADLAMEILRLRGQQEVLLTELDSLKRRSAHQTHLGTRDPGSQIPATEQALADVEQRLEKRLNEQQRLTLAAPTAGVVMPARHQPSRSASGQLETWSGSPLDESNRGAYLQTGTLFCLVGDPNRLQAMLVVDQSDIEFVSAGQTVRLQLDQLAGCYLKGEITEISRIDVETAPPELAVAGNLPQQTDADGNAQLVGVFYQVNVSLDEHPHKLLSGAAGQTRIHAPPLSLGRRILRYLSSTFRLQVPG